MKKLTTKQRTLLEAARDRKAYAYKTGFRSSRVYAILVDHDARNFNDTFDRLIERGLLEVGARTGGHWGPRFINITAAGETELAK